MSSQFTFRVPHQRMSRLAIRTLVALTFIYPHSPGALAQEEATISLLAAPEFLVQRDCLRNCFDCYECGVIDSIGCWYNNLDACFCRSDQAAPASSAITSCILSECSGHTEDLSRGVSLYDGYCSRNGNTLTGFADPTIQNTISIFSQPDYSAQKNCLQSCFGCYECGVIDSVGCWYQNADACFCRQDLAGMVSSALTTCVNSACSGNKQDVSNAVSLYDGYCQGVAAVGEVPASTTIDGASPSRTSIYSSFPTSSPPSLSRTSVSSSFAISLQFSSTTVDTGVISSRTKSIANTLAHTVTKSVKTNTATQTDIPTGGDSSGKSKGLSQSDRIALGVGLGIGIPTLILMAIGLYMRK